MDLKDSLQCSKEPAIFPIMSQINPIQTDTCSFFKIDFNIILSCTTMYPKTYFYFRLSDKLCPSYVHKPTKNTFT
jgi:hypothetical protein